MIVTNDTYKDTKQALSMSNQWVIDVETNGLNPYGSNQICGLGICSVDGELPFNIIFRFGINKERIYPQQLVKK